MERERQEAIARQEAMAEDLRKAELVRDRLESLDNSAKAYPEGHDMRVLIEGLHIDQAPRSWGRGANPSGGPCPPSCCLRSHRVYEKTLCRKPDFREDVSSAIRRIRNGLPASPSTVSPGRTHEFIMQLDRRHS